MMGRITFKRALVAAYAAIERLVPQGASECFISYPDVDDNALAAYCELVRRDPAIVTKLVWLVQDVERARNRLAAVLGNPLAGNAKVLVKNSLCGIWHFLRARRVFFTHGHYWFVRPRVGRAKLVNLWHGMPLKAIGLLDGKSRQDVQATEVTIASSSFFRPLMAKAFGIDEKLVLVTGLPRCDQLARPTEGALRGRRLFARDDKKLVVWMPTYCLSVTGEIRADSDLDRAELSRRFAQSLQILSGLAQASGCVVVVKLHPMDFLNEVAIAPPSDVVVLQKDSHILTEVGLYELLAVADGLITDASSVSFDFMATSKPILITSDFFDVYSRDLLFDIDELHGAVLEAKGLADAGSFFELVSSGMTVESSKSDLFCAFKDASSSARLFEMLRGIDSNAVGAV